MSYEIERFFELQDEATKVALIESKGDELTDVLVAALEDVAAILAGDVRPETLH
ncbi:MULTISPECIES: hypothetical protein [unclassified Rhizobium]|jgi:hypothetical protein|uniref:hypothetical protein n=1 Tax=unclassified Rhizobium TaxID=2613769 RepID=UPI0018E98742|nr:MULTISPECIES: hypothetical protein [unclassified Rhizobium]MDM9621803.1 hypothetical protein [Rhizobium sp. S96]